MTAQPDDCIFCKIVQKQIPASIIFDNANALAFLDVNPLTSGHVLVIPKVHAHQLVYLPETVAADLGRLLPKLGRALLKVTGADGFNVLQNNGEVAGQLVNHVHFHLIPRFENDGLGYRWNAGSYDDGQMSVVSDSFKQALV